LLNAGGLLFLVQCLLIFSLSFLLPEKEIKKYPFKREIRFERNLVVVLWSILLVTFIFSIYAILM
jgi:amino acid permease